MSSAVERGNSAIGWPFTGEVLVKYWPLTGGTNSSVLEVSQGSLRTLPVTRAGRS